MSQPQICFSTTIASFAAAIFLFVVVLFDAMPAAAGPGVIIEAPPFAAPLARSFDYAPRQLGSHTPPTGSGDELAVLRAIDVALTEAGDGATYVWKRGNGRLSGAILVTGTFRDANRRICRHLQVTITAGTSTRRTEGIACRQPDRAWTLEG